jgi:hypothetical protein
MNELTIDINDIFEDARKEFEETKLCDRLREKYRPKPYHEKNAHLYKICTVGAYIFSALSILTGCGFSIFLAAGVFPIVAAVIVGLIPLVIIELLQHLLVPRYYRNKYQYGRNNWYMLFISVCLFSGSVFLSFKGTQVAINHFSSAPELINIDSVKQPFQAEISKLDGIKSTAQNTKWKNTVTRDATKLLNKTQEQSGTFTAAMFQAVSKAEQANNERIDHHQSETAKKAYIGAYLQIFFAVMLFCMLWYKEFYDWQTVSQMGKTRTVRFLPDKKAPPVNLPKPLKEVVPVSATETRLRNIPETVSTAEINVFQGVSEPIQKVIVPGFNKGKPMTLGHINSKLKQYRWKLKTGTGNKATNKRNIEKFESALKKFKNV